MFVLTLSDEGEVKTRCIALVFLHVIRSTLISLGDYGGGVEDVRPLKSPEVNDRCHNVSVNTT